MTAYVLVTMVLFATILLVWGLRGKRIGDQPQCRKCGYGLTGLTAQCCPECATPVDVKTVVYGARRRRSVSLVLGVGLLMLSTSSLGTLLYGNATNIDWYTYCPDSLLRLLVKDRDFAAATELANRLQRKNPSRLPDDVINVALAEHAACPVDDATVWANILACSLENRWLSEEQTDQFFRQIARLSLGVAPQLQEGAQVVLEVHIEDRGSRMIATEMNLRIDDVVANGLQDVLGSSSWFPVDSPFIPIRQPFVARRSGPSFTVQSGYVWGSGVHDIACSITMAMFDPIADGVTPLWEHSLTLEARTTVAPVEPGDPIMLVDRPFIAESLMNTMTLETVQLQPRDDGPDVLSALINLAEPEPLCLAFEAYVITEEHQIYIGPMSWRAGAHGWEFNGTLPPSSREPLPDLPAEVHLELVASRDAASAEPDCYEVWEGTLRLGPVALIDLRSAALATDDTARDSNPAAQSTVLVEE